MTSASEISVGGARQPVAALDAALGGDDAGVPQLREDVLEELDRNALSGRDAVALGRPVAGDRELRARPQRIVDLRRDAHTQGDCARTAASVLQSALALSLLN